MSQKLKVDMKEIKGGFILKLGKEIKDQVVILEPNTTVVVQAQLPGMLQFLFDVPELSCI